MGPEETTGVGDRISALKRKVEKIKSFLVKMEKFLDDKDRLEKQNLGGKEKEESSVLDELQQYLRDAKVTKNQKEEIQASRAIASHAGGSPESSDPILEQNQLMTFPEEKNGRSTQKTKVPVFVSEKVADERGMPISVENLLSEEQLGDQKEADAERTKPACQLFDQMIVRGKVVTNKRKKKRWKASLEIQEGLEKHLSSEEKERTSPSWIEVRNRFGAKGKKRVVNQDMYACQVLDKTSMVQKRATRKKKKKFTKVKRSKYKCGKVNQEEYKFRRQNNKSLMKQCKLVNYLVSYIHQIFGTRFRRRITKKRKKRTRLEEHEREVIKHELVFAKLFWGHKAVLKKLARWKKHKFKQNTQRAEGRDQGNVVETTDCKPLEP
ncbi:unnamed protein product [Microthlaspi erraticum]|uniref:Uncharacterized protein n=1 Tax=Microthlaspi erraticum TaxID=1685480 RepID=A0A6D2J5V9_9BRAS|nr:unnamed protein product [Microthlaspi erraticum]